LNAGVRQETRFAVVVGFQLRRLFFFGLIPSIALLPRVSSITNCRLASI
jgi:hypothetical protein